MKKETKNQITKYPKHKFFRIFNIKRFVLDFTKITSWLGLLFYFKPRYYYENKKKQNRNIKGRAVVMSNHRDYWDPVFLTFTFFTRRIRFVAAEVVFQKKPPMPWFLKQLGCIQIDRNVYDYQFMKECMAELNQDGIVTIFPEGRLNQDSASIKVFKSGVVLMAIKTNSPIIPIYIGGEYGFWKRQIAIIGEPILPTDYCKSKMPTLEEIDELCKMLYEKECQLKEQLNAYELKRKKYGKGKNNG